ncbi:hypothetical protein Llon_1356 [Legionella londiniensis]|uniref:Uncharacterized protein n=2 Tax=Legionella londiniensis TaxID=45068 RepID=A0A0W0VMA9_9GAMM|nr:hypothetical protein [Legionella londiniensis]KTD21258.1 hypothetical protein Llon_1356 [Legionella londiniensis]
MLPPMNELLAYRNEHVVHYYCYHHPETTEDEARQLLNDLLGWIWLKIYRNKAQRRTYLFGPLLPIDAMWHAFILHTRDYHLFCTRFFGDYIHHDIEPPGREYHLKPDELQDFLNDCFQFLGDEWVHRYFDDFIR